MAIYHFAAKIVQRSKGHSVVAGAAYRSGSRLHDARLGVDFDYSKKAGVEYSAILAPEGAPEWVRDRARLWNAVEAQEKRSDSQLARELEVALPVELSKDEQIALLKDFVQRQFVSQGMVADVNLHRDNPENPHAHVLLTMRTLTADGFGLKERAWNARGDLLDWRLAWAAVTNEHLARAGLDLRIDHRSLKDQRSELTPGEKIGVSRARQASADLPEYLAERTRNQHAIAAENGAKILANPKVALEDLSRGQATFTHQDIARFLATRTDGAEQFQAAYLKVTTSPELVRLGVDDFGRVRFTTEAMRGLERELFTGAAQLAGRTGHAVEAGRRAQVLEEGAGLGRSLSLEQTRAFEAVTGGADLAVVAGVAGAGKSTFLGAARAAWAAQGYHVKGATLAGIAADNLQSASGIRSRTLMGWSRAWEDGRDPLTARDVFVVDEAGMVGTRQLAEVVREVERAGAKLVLVGDAEQLQAIEAGAAFRGIAAEHGAVALAEVRRQSVAWQREATLDFASGRTARAIAAYAEAGDIRAFPTREAARAALVSAWGEAGRETPQAARLMLAHTRTEVDALNATARAQRQGAGELGAAVDIETDHGPRAIAVGERVMFLKNDTELGVKNGTLGTVEGVRDQVLIIRLDHGARVEVDPRFYPHLEYGYAATVHKAQGTTVDRTFVLASPGFDRHLTYVALSRHRAGATLYYGQEDFAGRGQEASAHLTEVLSRARWKDLAHDYLDRGLEPERREPAPVATERGVGLGLGRVRDATVEEVTMNEPEPEGAQPRTAPEAEASGAPVKRSAHETLEAIRARARAQWAANREAEQRAGRVRSSAEEQRLGRERWAAYRAQELSAAAKTAQELAAEREREREQAKGRDPELGL